MAEPRPTGGTGAAACAAPRCTDGTSPLGAKMADFGGWEMPIEYPGGGVLREHDGGPRARSASSTSATSARCEVRGPGAAAFVDACLTNDLDRIGPGQAQYTLCCDDATGGVVDDLIVYLRGDDDVLLVPNAANTAEVARRLAAAAPAGVSRRPTGTTSTRVLAVQGPRSPTRCWTPLGLPTGYDYMSFVDSEPGRARDVMVCRTGYTGEHGYELRGPRAIAGRCGTPCSPPAPTAGGLPCGLGARDTLRTEMGYPLHGQDLSLEITPGPGPAGLGGRLEQAAFWGRDVAAGRAGARTARGCAGLLALDRGVPRAAPGGPLGADGPARRRGTTSGTFSPTLRQGIALALLDPAVAEGDEVVGRRARPAAAPAGWSSRRSCPATSADPPEVATAPPGSGSRRGEDEQRRRGGHLDAGAQDVAGDPAQPADRPGQQRRGHRRTRRARRAPPRQAARPAAAASAGRQR